MTEDQRRVAAHYERFGPAIYRRCLKLLRDPERARDATQDVFLKLIRELATLKDDRAVFSWIYRTSTHHCLNVLRDTTRRGRKEATLLAGDGMALDYPLVAPETLDHRRLASRVLSRFDAQTQAVAIGVLVDGMQHDEVADALGISRKTVSRKLDRFLVNARKYLARSEP